MLPPLLLALACSTPAPVEPAPVEPEPEPRPDVVVITLDTTRADRIGAWGYEPATTDTLDRMAAEGRRYSRAYSPLPLTIPAHSSLFTGRYPPHLGLRDNGGGTLSRDEVLLSEVLHEQGWATGASVAAYVTTRVWGFDQGFDDYFDDVPRHTEDYWHASRPGSAVVEDAVGWVDAHRDGEAPLFLWVHLYDAHFPYTPIEPYASQHQGRPYDGEISYLDDQVQAVVDTFAGRDALFVVVGDHGEGLGDHGELNHGLYVYDATQHVPLILWGHGIEPAVVDEPVSLVDVTPTVLDLLGLPIPEGVDGRVVPAAEPAPVYLESYQLAQRFGIAPHVGVVDGSLKLLDTPRPELYDVIADPAEQHNLAAERPDDVARLREVLAGFAFEPPGATDEPDPAVALQLEALGYVEGGFAGELPDDMPDPKDHRDLVRLSQRADRQNLMQNQPEALAALDELVQRYPDVTEFRARKSTLLDRMGRREEALVVVQEALERDPSSKQLRYSHAALLAETGDFTAASQEFQELVDDMSYAPRVRTTAVLSLAVSDAGVESAIELGLRYLEQYPEDANLAGLLGVQLASQQNFERARPLLEQGITASRPERNVAYMLVLTRPDATREERLSLLELELRNYPENTAAARTLAAMYSEDESWQGIVDVLSRSVRVAPGDPVLWHGLAQARFNLQDYQGARTTLDAALALHPADPMLMVLDANLLMKEGHEERAQARFAEAQALVRDGTEAVAPDGEAP